MPYSGFYELLTLAGNLIYAKSAIFSLISKRTNSSASKIPIFSVLGSVDLLQSLKYNNYYS